MKRESEEATVAQHAVVIGVSGSGKSTVGQLLASRLDRPFIEGDSLHPPENVARMASGVPLTDTDRLPWLEKIAETLSAAADDGQGAVVACSALRVSYRDILRRAGEVFFVHLNPDVETLRERLRTRVGHFMPESLLASQLDTMERLRPDERGVEVTSAEPPDAIVDLIVRQLPPEVLAGTQP